VLAAVLADFTLINLAQLVHLGCLTSDGALNHLNCSANHSASADCVRSCLCLDLDDTNSGIVLTTIVYTVAKIAYPSLESRTVVFLDHVSVGDDASFAGDRGPFTGAVEEGDVNAGIGGEVVGFAGLGIRVENQINATCFLFVTSDIGKVK
jgi:hypothetical protein